MVLVYNVMSFFPAESCPGIQCHEFFFQLNVVLVYNVMSMLSVLDGEVKTCVGVKIHIQVMES